MSLLLHVACRKSLVFCMQIGFPPCCLLERFALRWQLTRGFVSCTRKIEDFLVGYRWNRRNFDHLLLRIWIVLTLLKRRKRLDRDFVCFCLFEYFCSDVSTCTPSQRLKNTAVIFVPLIFQIFILLFSVIRAFLWKRRTNLLNFIANVTNSYHVKSFRCLAFEALEDGSLLFKTNTFL